MQQGTSDFFLHLPKTGGSSLRTLMTINYQPDQILSLYGNQPEIFQSCLEARKNPVFPVLTQGHIPYGVHNYLGVEKPNYYFFLREPVARTISDIQYSVRDNTHGFHSILGQLDINLMRRVQLASEINYYRNNMTHYVSGVFFSAELNLNDLHRAIDRVWKAKFVGITEYSEQSLLIMAKKIGWKFAIPQKMNVAEEDPKLKRDINDVRPLCESFLGFDRQLYQVALERFHITVDEYGSLLVEATAQLMEIMEQQEQEFPNIKHARYEVGTRLLVPILDNMTALPESSPLKRWFSES